MNQTVTLEIFYLHSPARVWQALTDRRALAAWMMDNDFEPRLGHRFHFQQVDGLGLERYIDCEVIELDPPKRLAYRWQECHTEHSTIVTWTLTAVAGGTTLQLRHHQPVQTTAISPSVMLQRSRAISNAMPHEKVYESPMNTLVLGWVNDTQILHPSSVDIDMATEDSLELQARWHRHLMRLNQKLSSDVMSDLITEPLTTENKQQDNHVKD